MPALEAAEIIETTNIPARKACPNTGCSCRDARIVSFRRAAFYAAVARSSGQTADRIIPADPEWRIPAAAAAGLDLGRALADVESPATAVRRPSARRGHRDRKERPMITYADISSATARQAGLRREAADARLARIGGAATPRWNPMAAVRSVGQIWNGRRDLGFAGGLRNEP